MDRHAAALLILVLAGCTATWTQWYVDALDRMRDIDVGGASDGTLETLEGAKARVAGAGAVLVDHLKDDLSASSEEEASRR